jgi:hypothetical protein
MFGGRFIIFSILQCSIIHTIRPQPDIIHTIRPRPDSVYNTTLYLIIIIIYIINL